jgi:hypothetical protein
VRPKLKIIDTIIPIIKIAKGIGSCISATKGARHANEWATRFVMPYTVATNLVGKSLGTEMYPILKPIVHPTLAIQIIIGRTTG